MVHPEITIVMMPKLETETSKSRCIAGHPEPKRESGSPKLMKAR